MRTQRIGSPRPTLDQVAAHAGVGRGTVSRVVNGSPQVSPEARAAVQHAIAELGYVPNPAARALVTRRTDAVALVVSESDERLFGEPFFAGAVRGISAGLADTSLLLWLAMTRTAAGQIRVEKHLGSQYVDGVMVLSLQADDPLPAVLTGRGIPVVLGGVGGRGTIGGGTSRVDIDDAGGAAQAARHLLDRGRRRIGVLAGPADTTSGAVRLAGCRQVLPVDDRLVAFGEFSEAGGATGTARLLAAAPDLDGIVAGSDLMAVGALGVLRAAGRRVPGDVAVVGFEDAAVAGQTDPPLTTVREPAEELGREMARLMVAVLADGEHRRVTLSTTLVRRGST
jgi:DNA-binding LacI/PurR family transcriptional regulator